MSNSLKRERSGSGSAASAAADASSTEYDEWARKLINRPIPQIGVPGAGIHQIGIQQIVADGVPANEGYDLDSAIGRFSWETIAAPNKNIPTIYRNGQQFCSIRMLEGSVLNDLLQLVTQEIYDSAKLTSYFVTNAEAKLLNYINTWHCEGQYGAKNFTGQDLIVTLEESKKLYEYIYFAYNVLSTGGKNQDNDYSKCGFVRVNNDSLIPYTVLKDGDKSVPLFYFEGQIEILKEKAEPLSGWELAYLKICCKVQGVRKDLIAGDSLQVVKLADLRSYFPKRSTFEENCWPPPKGKSLLPKQSSISSTASTTSVAGYYSNSHGLTNGPKIPNRVASNDNFQNHTNVVTVRTAANSVGASNSRTNHPNNYSISTQSASVPNHSSFSRTNGNSTTNAITTSSGRINFTVNNNNLAHGLNRSITTPNGITIHVASAQTPSTRGSSELKKIRVLNPPADLSRLTTILEHVDGSRVGAYKVQTTIIEGDTAVHCINEKPFKSDRYLLLLQDLMNKFFPNVSIYPTAVSVLKSIGLTTFLPNSSQITALNNYGFTISRAWEAPLVSTVEAVALLPRIKLLLTPKPTPTRVASAYNNTMASNNAPRTNNGYNASVSNSTSRSYNNYYSNSTLGHAR